jgi:hypothetical protein
MSTQEDEKVVARNDYEKKLNVKERKVLRYTKYFQ